MKRGDVYEVALAPRSGSEQRGRRPAIVMSHDVFNQKANWRSIIVIPISTSQSQANRGPTAVPLSAGQGGLARDSVALCHQITTLDRSKFIQELGTLSDVLVEEVERGIKAALDLI